MTPNPQANTLNEKIEYDNDTNFVEQLKDIGWSEDNIAKTEIQQLIEESIQDYQTEYEQKHIASAVQVARIELLQGYLEQIDNYKPDPTAPRYGSISGAIEVASWREQFKSDIARIKENK